MDVPLVPLKKNVIQINTKGDVREVSSSIHNQSELKVELEATAIFIYFKES